MIKRKACWVLFAQVRKWCQFKSWNSWKMSKLPSSRHLETVKCCKCQDKIDNKQHLFPKAESKNWWAWPQFSWGSISCFSHCKTVLPTIKICRLPSASHDHYLFFLFIVKLVNSVPSTGQSFFLKDYDKNKKMQTFLPLLNIYLPFFAERSSV